MLSNSPVTRCICKNMYSEFSPTAHWKVALHFGLSWGKLETVLTTTWHCALALCNVRWLGSFTDWSGWSLWKSSGSVSLHPLNLVELYGAKVQIMYVLVCLISCDKYIPIDSIHIDSILNLLSHTSRVSIKPQRIMAILVNARTRRFCLECQCMYRFNALEPMQICYQIKIPQCRDWGVNHKFVYLQSTSVTANSLPGSCYVNVVETPRYL